MMSKDNQNKWLGIILTGMKQSKINKVKVITVCGSYEIDNKVRMNKMVRGPFLRASLSLIKRCATPTPCSECRLL